MYSILNNVKFSFKTNEECHHDNDQCLCLRHRVCAIAVDRGPLVDYQPV